MSDASGYGTKDAFHGGSNPQAAVCTGCLPCEHPTAVPNRCDGTIYFGQKLVSSGVLHKQPVTMKQCFAICGGTASCRAAVMDYGATVSVMDTPEPNLVSVLKGSCTTSTAYPNKVPPITYPYPKTDPLYKFENATRRYASLLCPPPTITKQMPHQSCDFKTRCASPITRDRSHARKSSTHRLELWQTPFADCG